MWNNYGTYTMEIGQIIKHGGQIFDFDYSFYNPEHKKEFERKFILHFRYYEIGQETLERFKWMLQDILEINYPKYCHYYKTQLKAAELQWWNNKDYQTEFRRTLDSEGSSQGTSNSNGQQTGSFNSHSSDNTKNVNKFLETPQGKIENLEDGGYLTNATIDTVSNETNGSGNSQNNSLNNSSNNSSRKGKDIETIFTKEAGNIGTTSSADLVKSWLEYGLIDVDKLIFKDCEQLFMLIY